MSAPGPPAHPGQPSVLTRTDSSLTFAWDAPPHNGGSPVTGYFLKFAAVRAHGEGAAGLSGGAGGGGRVDAAPSSSSSSSSPSPSCFEPATSSGSTGGGLKSSGGGSGGGGGGGGGKTVGYEMSTEEISVMHSVYAGDGLSCSLTDLAPATEYAARVEAVNAEGASPWSTTCFARTRPATPAAPIAVGGCVLLCQPRSTTRNPGRTRMRARSCGVSAIQPGDTCHIPGPPRARRFRHSHKTYPPPPFFPLEPLMP